MQFMRRTIRYADDAYCTLHHLSYYFSKGPVQDDDRQRLLDFKKNEEYAQRYYVLNALECLRYDAPEEDLIILRALSSDETDAKNRSTALERLGDCISMAYNCSFYPDIITKKRVTRPLKTLSLKERMIEMRDVYQVDPNVFNLDERPVMIIDDVITTGATVGAIISAIIKKFPRAKITVLAMAWTPAPAQQYYLQKRPKFKNMASDAEQHYGCKTTALRDDEFICGETNVSVFG